MKKEKKEASFRLRMSAKDRELLEENAKKNNSKNASDYLRMLIQKDKQGVSHEHE